MRDTDQLEAIMSQLGNIGRDCSEATTAVYDENVVI